MEKVIVRGGRTLSGEVKVHGSKNAVLPILAASLLASKGRVRLLDVPLLEDVHTMLGVLASLGVLWEQERDGLCLVAERIVEREAPYELVRKMRGSFLVMGPLLARCGVARVPLPGGCAIGTRPIDQHLKGLEALGAQMEIGHGVIEATAKEGLKGSRIYLDVPSVGATENIMMAATLASGTTLLENAAQEPEIVDLANFLNSMGAKVRGAGTGMIRIEGVSALRGVTHQVIPDRIEAGTLLLAGAITGGDVFVEGAIGDHIKPLIAKLREMGAAVEEGEAGVRVRVCGPLRPVDVKTLPYPGFPTDMQAPFMALLLTVRGTSRVTETVFENRFMHVEEFRRLNARIAIDGRTAVIEGGAALSGASMMASDLRAAAALILAGLSADGESHIYGLDHLDRGYVDLCGKLSQLGGRLQRVDDGEGQRPDALTQPVQQVGNPLLPSLQLAPVRSAKL